ncbi:MAG TPA: hypothetical protein DHW63_04510 [Hyphomonadaceae bacterium]|nr:hypothetical protein [Hyphomonadaceae bacterium]
MGGSQEIETTAFLVGDEVIVVEAETYVGLSILGESATIRRIANEVAKRCRKGALTPTEDKR